MFKILALVVFVATGEPIDVLVSNADMVSCPTEEGLTAAKEKLQGQLDSQDGLSGKAKVTVITCVPKDKFEDAANALFKSKGI